MPASAASAPKRKTGLRLDHLDACPEQRIESYDANGPSGPRKITRCLDCGAEIVATDEPKEKA